MDSEKQEEASLHVGGLHPCTTEAQLFMEFSAIGPIASLRVCRDRDTQQSLGYGYVNYQNAADAQRAINTLHQVQLNGMPLKVAYVRRNRPASGNPTQRQEVNLYIKNLEDAIDDQRLRDLFAPFGSIISAKVMLINGRSKGFGFVCFENPDAASIALSEMNGRIIEGKPLYIAVAQKKEDRKAHLQTMLCPATG